MVTWFSGLFYLPRLFVYHSMATDKISLERFKVMERKLYYGIMLPSAILTISLGLWLLYDHAWSIHKKSGWLHLKLTLALVLTIYHLYCGHLMKKFKHDKNQHGHVFYRWLNEFPVIILISIILLINFKPF